MTDAFALLDESRRPWLDAGALKTRFQALSAAVHPDRTHGASETEQAAANARFAELNAAFRRLQEPRERLLHLLELERGAPPRDIQRLPPGTMDLFVEVGQTCRDADAHLQAQVGATSPMLRLQGLRAGLEWVGRLTDLQRRVRAKREELDAELQRLNGAWETAPPVGTAARPSALPLERLEEIYRTMSYVARWAAQIDERLVQLAS